jgi:hypothetical protein
MWEIAGGIILAIIILWIFSIIIATLSILPNLIKDFYKKLLSDTPIFSKGKEG